MRLNLLILLLVGAVMFTAVPVMGAGSARFVLMDETEDYSYYLDTETLRQIPDPYRDEKLVDAWIKAIPSGQGRQKKIADRQNNLKSTDGYEAYGYSLNRYYFRLKQRQLLVMDRRDFSGFGAPLDAQSFKYDILRWEDLVPDTPPDAWYDFIVKRLTKKSDS